jgi:uncharacterized circularly permuted ATP-grasp superfamily protein
MVIALTCCEFGGGNPWSPQLRESARRQIILEALGIHAADSRQLEVLCHDGNRNQCRRAIVNFAVDSREAFGMLDEMAFERRRLPMMNSPGTGLLGNKALLPYVEDMIRFFCEEEPLVATPTTRLLRDGALPDDPDNWVVKLAAGRQGTEVFVLSMQSSEQLAAIRKLVARPWPDSGAVAQVAIEPSRLSPMGPGSWEAYRLELRPTAYVIGWQEVYVADQPVGKAVSNFDLKRLNNISQGACYVAVVLVDLRMPTVREI